MESLGIKLDQIIFQMINFGLVYFVLSKFLYKPVLDFIKKQKNETEKLKDLASQSEKTKLEVQKMLAESKVHSEKMAADMINHAENSAKNILNEAKKEASKEGSRILQEYALEAQQTKDALLQSSREEINKQALQKVEEFLRNSLTPDQKAKLLEESIQRLTKK